MDYFKQPVYAKQQMHCSAAGISFIMSQSGMTEADSNAHFHCSKISLANRSLCRCSAGAFFRMLGA